MNMNVTVSVQEKRSFLEWLITRPNMKDNDINWFLEDLLQDEHTLAYVQFVEHIQDCPKGIKIILDTDQVRFLFFKGKVKTTDVYTAYHELHLYNREQMFIHIHFPEKEQNALYLAVIEADFTMQHEIKETTSKLLAQLAVEGEKNLLKQHINKALEKRDYPAFIHYSNALKKVMHSS